MIKVDISRAKADLGDLIQRRHGEVRQVAQTQLEIDRLLAFIDLCERYRLPGPEPLTSYYRGSNGSLSIGR